MIQTDDLDKPLAERCDQFNRLVEVKQHFFIQKLLYRSFLFLEKEKRTKTNKR
jgi:hypothetical protein